MVLKPELGAELADPITHNADLDLAVRERFPHTLLDGPRMSFVKPGYRLVGGTATRRCNEPRAHHRASEEIASRKRMCHVSPSISIFLFAVNFDFREMIVGV